MSNGATQKTPSLGGVKRSAQIFQPMDNQIPPRPSFDHNPRVLAQFLYRASKRFWFYALSLKVGGAFLGIGLILKQVASPNVPVWVFTLAVASELCQWRSDVLKGQAESLTRKIEFDDGFGWSLSPSDLGDQLAKTSAGARKKIAAAVEENYFASQKAPSPRRAVENLCESAWWSKHLSSTMIFACSSVSALLLGCCIFVLFTSINSAKADADLVSLSRVVTAVLSLIVTLGFSKLIVGYYSLRWKAERTEQNAKQLLAKQDVTELQAVQLLHEYQISRASAPLIPDVVWRMRRDELNDLWAKYQCEG